MSKRYGRNQKRAARKQIEELRHGIDMANGLASHIRHKLDEARQIVADCTRVVGNNFIAMPPDSVEVRSLDRLMPSWRFAATKPLPSFGSIDDIAEMAHFIDIAGDVLRLNTGNSDIDMAKHIKFTLGNKCVGYAITQQAMQLMPKDMLVSKISREMAEMMVSEFKK